MTTEQKQDGGGKLKAVLGFALVIISGAFALTMVMRFVGRFLIFLVVDRPEIGFGFLLSTFATTALGVYVAWQVGRKGLELSGGQRSEVIINEGVRDPSSRGSDAPHDIASRNKHENTTGESQPVTDAQRLDK